MSRIRPFRALRFDTRRVELSRVIAPPYDVVAPAERAAYFDRDPHNAIRLELTRDVADEAGTDYAGVPETLAAWQRQGALVRDARPAFYALRQRFRDQGGSLRTRDGFFALLHLEDYARRIVRPHERTLAGPKADRLKLLRASRANLSSVFLLYEDRECALDAVLGAALDAALRTEAEDDAGTRHELVPIDEAATGLALQEFLAERPLVIADGHHRYETALAYRDECRSAAAERGAPDADAPHEWVLAYLSNAFAPGSLLLPIHRLIRKGPAPTRAAWRARLTGWTREAVPVPDAEAVPALLAAHLAPLADRHAFAADDASGELQIFWRPADSRLTIRVVHEEIIEGVFGLDERAVREGALDYPKSALETARELRAGRGAVAIYLNPLSPEDVFRITAAGELLPQKSTFFLPKVPTGLVFRLLDP